MLLDDSAADITVLSHVGRPDDELHEAATRRAAKGTAGLRLRIDRFDARAKLSQNKTDDVRDTITSRLAADNPGLADEMRRHRG